jgi:hypothetical protein
MHLWTTVIVLSFLSFVPEGTGVKPDECTVKEIYEIIDHPRDAVVLTTSGVLAEADQLLVPARMKEGTYQVTVTRKGRNIYQLDNMEYVIETRYCNEYAHKDKALLKVTGKYHTAKQGVLIFE